MATQYLGAAEDVALELGFRRFCVPGILNGPFWSKVMGYSFAREHQIGQTEYPRPNILEGYKEMHP